MDFLLAIYKPFTTGIYLVMLYQYIVSTWRHLAQYCTRKIKSSWCSRKTSVRKMSAGSRHVPFYAVTQLNSWLRRALRRRTYCFMLCIALKGFSLFSVFGYKFVLIFDPHIQHYPCVPMGWVLFFLFWRNVVSFSAITFPVFLLHRRILHVECKKNIYWRNN